MITIFYQAYSLRLVPLFVPGRLYTWASAEKLFAIGLMIFYLLIFCLVYMQMYTVSFSLHNTENPCLVKLDKCSWPLLQM